MTTVPDSLSAMPGRASAAGLALFLAATPAPGAWQASGGITAVYQQETRAGDDDTSVSGDLRLRRPTASGAWLLYVEGATGTDAESIFNRYPEINADAGSVLDSDGGSHVQVSELWYRFDLSGRSQLTLGQIDPSAQVDRSRIANDENTQFLGASFKNNLTIDFPDYTLGAIYRRLAAGSSPEVTLMLSSSDGIADNPTRSYRELVDLSGPGKGIFAAANARWMLADTEVGIGAWLRSDDKPLLDDPAQSGENRGVFAVVDRVFGPQVLSLRLGAANDEVSHAARFAAVAWRMQFARARLGLGYARIVESARAATADSGDTDHVEAWIRAPLGIDGLHASLSLQYLANPGFDRSGSSAEAHALIAALRFDYAFAMPRN